jgi:hypothetical protein
MTALDIHKSYAINAPDVVAEDFDGEIVILNLANGHYYALQGIGQRIWPRLLEGHTPESILASIAIRRADIAGPASAFIARLVELDLLIAAPQSASHGFVESWEGEAPAIEVYDDLAELIFADPVHDVDEQAGWPKKRTAP